MGAVEQHGPHLPVATDTILAQWIAERAAKEMLDKGIPVVIAPALSLPIPCTTCIFPEVSVLHRELYTGSKGAVQGKFAVQGFRKIAIINGHGGNTASY